MGDYLIGLLGLAAIAISLAIAARTARHALLPDWQGPPALLATTVLALAAYILLGELLGLVGILTGPLLVAASLLTAGAAHLTATRWLKPSSPELGRGPGEPPNETEGQSASGGGPPGPSTAEVVVGIGLAFLVAAQWAAPTLLAWDRGIYGGDSLWYHLPFAAHIAQTGSVTQLLFTDTLYLNWFYPQNSELVHAGGLLLFGNDFLSPLLNMAWLGLALLAGYCCGRPYRAGVPALAAVAALVSADLLVSRQPGSANNDIVAIALLLSAAAILLTRYRSFGAAGSSAAGGGPTEAISDSGGPPPDAPRGVVVIAALAAGLALGTKLTVVIPVAALTIGVIAIASAGQRLRTAAWWGGGLLAGGGYWYARNLVVSGNPFPWVHLGPLHKAGELEGRDPFSIAHYITDTGVWGKWFVPGLEERFGDLWPLALGLAVAGVVIGMLSGRRVELMLAAVAAVSAAAYLLTPLGAAGPEGMPVAFRLNIRYLAPALALALVLLAIPPRFAAGRERWWRWGALGAFAAIVLVSNGVLGGIDSGRLPGTAVLVVAVALPVGVALALHRGAAAPVVAGAVLASVLALAAIGRGVQTDYLDHRYSSDAPDYPAVSEHPGLELSQGLGAAYDWARGTEDARVALSGEMGSLFQYGLWGKDSSNDVRVIGRRGDSGSFDAVDGCPEYVAAVNGGGYDYLVTTPTSYDQDHPDRDTVPVERAWVARAHTAQRVAGAGLVDVWRLAGPLDPAVCAPG